MTKTISISVDNYLLEDIDAEWKNYNETRAKNRAAGLSKSAYISMLLLKGLAL